MKGRKQKPTELKKLQGNPGKRPLNTSEPQFDKPSRMPKPPDYLSESAAGVWRKLGKMLLDVGLFTVVDEYALAMFAEAAGRWIDAQLSMEQEFAGPVLRSPDGRYYRNPHMISLEKAWGDMNRMFSEFGLTPAERARIKVTPEMEEEDIAAQLFKMVKS